jgi:pimeloyl-ACP methyl ester carboxylesterase
MDRNWDLTSGMDDKAIDAPALYIVGTRDSTYGWMPQDPTERAPRLRVEILDGVGHWIQQQSPDEVNAELLALLAEAEWQ